MPWRNFDYDEFACQCGTCGFKNHMSETVIDDLQEIRTVCDFPFIITSGYRCADHPIEAAKDEPGPHNTGLAMDIALSGKEAIAVQTYAMMNIEKWRGFGLNQKGDYDERYLHLDQCSAALGRPRPHIWTY